MMKILLIIIAALFNLANYAFAMDVDSIESKAKNIFSYKDIVSRKLTPNNFNDLINRHLQSDPRLKMFEANEKSSGYYAKAIESSFTPNLMMRSSLQDYDTYHREVSVFKPVPVKYDNDNPIVTNINLPNGGQGIVWLPRPIAWEKKDINLKTSLSYRSRSYENSVSLNYMTPFGLKINAFEYDLDYRFHPKTYGYPWTARLNSSFFLPVFKNFGKDGSERYTELQVRELSKEISKESLESTRSSKIAQLFKYYFQLYYSYSTINHLEELESILNVQKKDVDLLIAEGRIPVSEGLNIKHSGRQIEFRIDSETNNFLNLCSKLNVDNSDTSRFEIFIPGDLDVDRIIEQLYDIFENNIKRKKIKQLVDEHPQANISGLELQQSEIKLAHADNQTLPEINFSVSAGTFQESLNYLGHNSPWNALRHSIDNPNGFLWSFNVQYVLPTGRSDENFYQYALQNKIATEEALQSTKKNIYEEIEEFIFQIKNAYAQIESYEENLRAVNEIIEKNAKPLFNKKRINRYDYYSYLKELESAKMMKLDAQNNFLNSFFMFCSEMNIKLDFIFRENRNE